MSVYMGGKVLGQIPLVIYPPHILHSKYLLSKSKYQTYHIFFGMVGICQGGYCPWRGQRIGCSCVGGRLGPGSGRVVLCMCKCVL